ncbi:hypothetical protein Dtox_4211 [Desulfofarcimen acetoxidans DSM 771]|uniref:Uncharacterized protein n=1 Tax=Desulfofarcimen acetoxidans (strain ATCC 49208 / DSM 771 / KCTC 5769 / VKM B-1644 / 5575) TaxID=485916 RepID=C8VZD3_DESAS|nr:hypothetical protein [Desulfofarcimen acetoxidans]ACV64878.1 hypothetical protein Dtox_4211 [Desulfofarcimen acetoxidans DSM 771]
MDQLFFNKIYKEVSIDIKLNVVDFMRTHFMGITKKYQSYPELVPRSQVMDDHEDLFLNIIDKIIGESIRASIIIVEKYHEEFHS